MVTEHIEIHINYEKQKILLKKIICNKILNYINSEITRIKVFRRKIMEIKFDQLFDFQYCQAIKLVNSSYLEDLTGLLTSVASRIDDESNYFFGDKYYLENHKDEPNSSFQHFIRDLKNTIDYGSCNKINIIRGRAGIGKSLFFEKGVKKLIRSSNSCQNDYIHMGVDFKNITNDEEVEFYINWIYKELNKRAIDSIRILGEEIYKSFNKEYENFGNRYGTPHEYLFPLKFFCEKIFKKYNKPCIIIFDNIDLASVKTQKKVFDAIVVVCKQFNSFTRQLHSPDCYRIYFAMRPETELRYNEGRVGEVINFPLPNILRLSLAIMKKSLIETAEEFDNIKELPCHVSCQNVMSDEDETIDFHKFSDVADYFYKILDYYLGDIWNNNQQTIERLGTGEEFHCNIVNYNVRMFVRFLSDTISNGGFKPFTIDFNQKQGAKYYNLFDYIEMIIKGRWIVHPGNRYIDGEGGNKAPIVFNIFDTSIYGNYQKDKIKHFMLNIRILQYFFLCGNSYEIYYEDMEQSLNNFFDVEHISNATKKLIYVRFLYSYIHGDNVIASIQNWEDVKITPTTKLKLSPVGRFYLEKLICEFEYQYQMALSSLICDTYVNELKSCWKTEKEQTVLYFLKSMFEIIKVNINEYNTDEIVPFKKLFYYIDDNQGSRPFRRMLDTFISVMRNKVQRAERRDTNNLLKLDDILNKAMQLKTEVMQYFQLVLGEER